ncbi:hypothetical protein SDC9_62640 [bioreactor metagenome]|uniref:Uncharacterized protein n=1 Tax=bioreactor metagenome TaxID=1076179 RepID=A0A644XJ83_9ZZZZ
MRHRVLTQKARLTARFRLIPFYPLVNPKRSVEQSLDRRQGGDGHAEQRIHADGQAVVDQRIYPGVGKPVGKARVLKEDRAGNGRGQHAAESRHRRTQRHVFRKEARDAHERERHEVVQHELDGMHDVRALNHLQKRKRKRRRKAVHGAEVRRVRKDGQHGNQRDRAPERKRKELEIAQHERQRQAQCTIDELLRFVERRFRRFRNSRGGFVLFAVENHQREQAEKDDPRDDEHDELDSFERGEFVKQFELHDSFSPFCN